MEAPQAEMSVVGRMLRVVFFSTYVTSPIYVAETMEQTQQQMSAEQSDEMEGTADAILISMLIAAPIMTFVMLFIGAAIYLLVGKLLGGLLDYGQCLAIVAYTSQIQSVIRIDEVEKSGVSKISSGDNITPLPVSFVGGKADHVKND